MLTGENENEETLEQETVSEEAEAVSEAETVEESAAQEQEATGEETENSVEDAEGGESGEAEEGTEETTDEESEEKVRICPNCHKNAIANDHNYCRKCEKKLVKVHVPVLPTLIALVVVIASFFAFIVVCLDSAPAIQMFQGDWYRAQKNKYSAYTSYSGVTDVIDSITESLGDGNFFTRFVQTGSNADMKEFETYAEISNPLSAYQNKSYIFTSAGSTQYQQHSKKFKYYEDFYNAYLNTYTALEEPLNELSSLSEYDKETTGKILKDMEAVRGQDGVDDVLLDYFIYNAAGMGGIDGDELYAYLDKTVEDDKANGEKYACLYQSEYLDSLVRRGENDEAKTVAQALMDEDISNYDAYLQMTRLLIAEGDMDAAESTVGTYCDNTRTEDGDFSDYGYALVIYLYRVQGKYDELHTLSFQAGSTYSLIPEYDRQEALAYLLEGDYDKAFESSYSAEDKAYYRYSYYSDSTGYTQELYATGYLCAYLCQKYGNMDTENAEQIPEILESFKGQDFGEKVNAVISGEKTVEEVLSEGVCDLI